MPSITTRLCCSLLAIAAGSAFAAEAIDMRHLSDSAVALADVSQPGSAGKSFVAATIINAPVPELCALIQNYEGYPSFMPNMQSTKVSQSGPSFSVIDVVLKLPLGKIKKYRLRMEPKSSAESCTVAWKLVPWQGLKQEETITDTTGSWQLTPGPATGKTTVKYTVFTDPGPIPFGAGWIVDSLSKDSIPQTLEALRKRAAAH
jgi:ribosome-associated toxin RatA of RatAB toxin-antitoxin module